MYHYNINMVARLFRMMQTNPTVPRWGTGRGWEDLIAVWEIIPIWTLSFLVLESIEVLSQNNLEIFILQFCSFISLSVFIFVLAHQIDVRFFLNSCFVYLLISTMPAWTLDVTWRRFFSQFLPTANFCTNRLCEQPLYANNSAITNKLFFSHLTTGYRRWHVDHNNGHFFHQDVMVSLQSIIFVWLKR